MGEGEIVHLLKGVHTNNAGRGHFSPSEGKGWFIQIMGEGEIVHSLKGVIQIMGGIFSPSESRCGSCK